MWADHKRAIVSANGGWWRQSFVYSSASWRGVVKMLIAVCSLMDEAGISELAAIDVEPHPHPQPRPDLLGSLTASTLSKCNFIDRSCSE